MRFVQLFIILLIIVFFLIQGFSNVLKFSQQTNELLIGLSVEMIGGALFFLVIVYLLRPKIKISKALNFTNRYNKTNDNSDYYTFKITNLSYFDTYDVKIEAIFVETYESIGAKFDRKITPIPLNVNYLNFLERNKFFNKKNNYFILKTDADLRKIFNENPNGHLVLTIISIHKVSSLSRIFKKTFCAKNIVINSVH